jgi:serine/threonine-protein kinase SRPK3
VNLVNPHDHRRNAHYVAVKALKGLTTDLYYQGYIHELHILQRVTQLVKRARQPVYCTPLLAHFIQPGKPNDGDHLCLVMDVFAGDVEALRLAAGRRVLPSKLVQRILRDSLRGLAQLHASGCVHTGEPSHGVLEFICWTRGGQI